MNWIFLALIVGAVVAGALGGTMPEVTRAGIESAKKAIETVVFLIGQMALWLGFMRVLREAGMIRALAGGLAPLMRRLFPDVPADHPAMGAMIMNLSANVFGLGNAATPFGLKAMAELQRLNPHPGVATNAMARFLAINTAGVAVLPLGVVALRASLGAENAGGIIVPSILATACSTVVALFVARSLEGRAVFAAERQSPGEAPAGGETVADGIRGLDEAEAVVEQSAAAAPWRAWALWAFLAVIAIGVTRYVATAPPDRTGIDLTRDVLSDWLLPVLMATILLVGFGHRVKVYEAFVKGAREGFDIAVMIIPFLVAILVAVGMFRASGMMDVLIAGVRPLTETVGFPPEALPMALVRPLSGSGALGVMTETMTAYGPDSFVGYLVSVINGSTETTFYVLAVYFGSVGVRAARHTVLACLAADLTGVAGALVFSHIFF
jgi:spore maturation protein SpmA